MPISRILELYAKSGHSLIGNGLNEAALPVSDAEIALDLFGQQRWRVLGGDVYRLIEGGQFEPTYESWFYEGTSVEESLVVARAFIGRLEDQSAYIVYVVDEQAATRVA